jgi:hypothetical protein
VRVEKLGAAIERRRTSEARHDQRLREVAVLVVQLQQRFDAIARECVGHHQQILLAARSGFLVLDPSQRSDLDWD